MNVSAFSLALYADALFPVEVPGALEQTFRVLAMGASVPVFALLAPPLVWSPQPQTATASRGTSTLILVGLVAAWVVSLTSVFRGQGPVFFDTVAMTLLGLTLGRVLLAKGRARALAGRKNLASLVPETAWVESPEGSPEETPLAEIPLGARVRVEANVPVALDGVLEDGSLVLDQASWTGEPVPVPVGPGERILAGCEVLEGSGWMRVDRIQGERLLDQMEARFQSARGERTPWMEEVESFARFFLAVVLLLAIATGFYWSFGAGPAQGLEASLSVLLVACPCALGIAAPLPLWMTHDAFARRGILAKSGETLERLAQIDRVFLDKTGTLTLGGKGRTRDQLRTQSQALVDGLKELGLSPEMVSGDKPERVSRVAESLGIPWHAERDPLEKAELLAEAKAEGQTILFLGDGVNDVPALGEAALGASLVGASDPSLEAADLLLVGSDLARLTWAIQAARAMVRAQKGNLFWAFGYNSILLALAASGNLHPIFATLAMLLSSAAILAHSLALSQRLETLEGSPKPRKES